MEIEAQDIGVKEIYLPANTQELQIVGVSTIKDLENAFKEKLLNTAQWEELFRHINDISDQVHILVGDESYVAQKITWNKKKGKTSPSQTYLTPEDDLGGESRLIRPAGLYFHVCPAEDDPAEARHFHRNSYRLKHDIKPTQVLAALRWFIEQGLKGNKSAKNTQLDNSGAVIWKGAEGIDQQTIVHQ